MVKVIVDAFQYLLSAMFAVAINQPFFGMAVAFAVIASIHAVTQGHNVRRYRARTIRVTQRYPMVSSGFMKQPAQWSAANGTTMLKVSQCIKPLFFRKGVGQVAFPGATAFSVNHKRSFVLISVSPDFMGVFSLPFTSASIHLISVFGAITCGFFSVLLFYLFGIFLKTARGVSHIFDFATGFALVTQLLGIFAEKEKFARGGKFFATNRTSLHGGHEHIPSWLSLLGCGQAAKLTVRTGNYSALVHMGSYTMKDGV